MTLLIRIALPLFRRAAGVLELDPDARVRTGVAVSGKAVATPGSLLVLEQAYEVPFGVVEHGEGADVRDRRRRDHHSSAQADRSVQVRLEIVHLDVECEVRRCLAPGLEDAPVYPS